ncbi:FAD/NAD(P)-binding oxidoreductase [Thermomicrobium sp. 4228-Ro]|uniref:NAD(P)/FAD-dependent oxidoreductase n=1 Tax=Thermomicrobium sp. 4228-Ro TaxID=2993937 RepID=UPI002248AB03|nr:FAD/NAD(P)-binding oxidoreductase [Thermomicrobium sp. 4228-Ro]MCX2727603.1 FAD/NAD(P)-binding oxidoreductase [Thermomicrobium sp. 4228-Ro]
MGKTIVILGAGPGGIAAARTLRTLLAPDDRIVVFDRQDEQRLGVSLLLVMRGWRDPDQVTIRPSRVLQGIAEFQRAEVLHIDPDTRTVQTSVGSFQYDALLLATGAELAPDSIPGLSSALENGIAGHCWSLPAALQLRERLRCFTGGRILVVIARLPYKCPPAPYEAALLIRDLVEERGLSQSTEIVVVTPEPSPLAVAGPAIGEQLTRYLSEHGIAVRTGEHLASVDLRHREASFVSGVRELFDLLVVVPPHRAAAVARTAGLVEGDWVPAMLHTMRTQVEGIWAIGDVTAVRIRDNVVVPKAAVFAQQQAEIAARDIARSLGYAAPEPEVRAFGRCWFLAGRGLAGVIEGDFLAEPRPAVTFQLPTTEGFAQMEAELTEWLTQDPGTRS